ncbi:MAG: metallophosphoesterase family protein [Bacilli bacterium]
MKLAIISDVHSNILGLNLAINDALKNNVDQFIFLGDYITDGDKNNEVLEIIKKYGNHVISGNRERYMCDYNPLKKYFSNYKTIANTYNNLSNDNLEYVKSLKNNQIINIDGYKILLTHGDGYGQPKDGLEAIINRIIEKYDFDICLFGHSHRYFNDKFNNYYFINPGSIGSPADTPTYKYVILDLSNGVNVQLREFDVEVIQQELEKQYKESDYYKENFEWCDLILKGIKDGQNYCSPFIAVLNRNLKNIDANDYVEFNKCWENTYNDFMNNFNIMDYKKMNAIFKENNLTNIKNFFEFCKNNFDYGWTDRKGARHYESNNSKKYFLQSPLDLLESKISICWDRTELYRAFFSRLMIEYETYFLYYYINDNNCPSHSILVYYGNGKVYWFEPMFNNEKYNYCGIHEYNNIEELLVDFKNQFTENGIANGFLPKDCKDENYSCYKYFEPKYYINDSEFYNHCRKCEKIDI